MRYLRRAIRIILLIVLFSVSALIILARTPLVNRLLRDKVVALVAANYRGTLSIARIEGSVWGSLRLNQVVLLYNGKTLVSIRGLSLDYSLVSLLWRTVHLEVSLDSPEIDASRQPDGKWDLLEALSARAPTRPSSEKRAITIDVDSVQINNGTLEVMPGGDSGPQYRVANLALDTGVRLPSAGMAIQLRRLTANVIAPKMPLVYAAVSLDYDALVSPATVRLTDVDLRTQGSTIAIAGEARLGRTPSIDLKLWLRELTAADIAQVYPASQLKADIAGTVALQGPENALHGTIALNCAGATLDGTADADVTRKAPVYRVKLNLANANLQRIVRLNTVAGVIDATINSKGDAADLYSATADVHLSGRALRAKQYELGTLDLTANAANKNADLTVALRAPAGYLTARAKTTIGKNPAYHFELAAQHLNVAKVGAGTKAPQTDVNFGALIDGYGLTPSTANTGIRLRVERSRLARIIVDRGLVDARVANNRASIAQFHFVAAGSTLNLRGSGGLAADAPAQITYRFYSPEIEEVLALAGMKGNGRVDVTGTVSGPRSNLWTRGSIELASLQTGGYSLRHGTGRYSLALTGPETPYGEFDAAFDDVKAGTELRTIAVALEAPRRLPRALALRLNVTDDAGRRDLVATRLTYQPPSIAGQLTQLTLGLPTGDWHLSAPVDYLEGPRGVSISRLELLSGSRQLVLQGTIARKGAQDFNLALNRFDLAALRPLTSHLSEVHGMLSTRLWIAGTAEAPTIRLAAQATALAVRRQPLGDFSATVNYAGQRGVFETVLHQNASDRLTAQGSLPMSLSWNQGLKAKFGNALELTLNSAHLSLAHLGSLFPDEVQNFQGAAAINLRVQGAFRHPEAAGSVALTGIGGQVVPLGITLSDSKLLVHLDPRAIRIDTIEAYSGRGSIIGNGEIGLMQYVPSELNVNLTFTRWPAIDTRQYAATIGGHLVADGTIRRPRLRGQLEVLNGTFQPDIAFLSATSNLSPDETIEVVQPGHRVAQPVNNTAGPNGRPFTPPAVPPQPSTFNNLAMKVAVIIHRNTWIRHPDAAVELEGNLEVNKDPGGPIKVAGEVRTMRGWMNYYNRQFTLKTGVFTFTGGDTIDPLLDINAQYPITNYIIDIVVGGTASKPTLQLKSQPELAQADILSLILFGRTTDTLSQGQRAGLQQQATKMATGVAAHQIGQAVASSMGLQRMGITLNDTASGIPSVGVGHYLGENTYVSASQPIGRRGGQKLSVQYFLLRWLSITTSSSADGSHEIDLNLIKQY
jgi:autotransporter translocation and assembly factor TamB